MVTGKEDYLYFIFLHFFGIGVLFTAYFGHDKGTSILPIALCGLFIFHPSSDK